jgi:hypothetical protein
MTMSGGDPQRLSAASGRLRGLSGDVNALVAEVAGMSHAASGAVGVPALAGAVERFAAAWGGQLLACGCATATLGSVATVASDQLTAATGGR